MIKFRILISKITASLREAQHVGVSEAQGSSAGAKKAELDCALLCYRCSRRPKIRLDALKYALELSAMTVADGVGNTIARALFY